MEAKMAQQSYVRVPEGVLLQHVADEIVLLHLESGVYYGLDPVGTRMLDLACELGGADAVVSTLLEEYETTAEVLERDLERLLGELVENGLVERVTEAPAEG
jgi:hypothetical protein